MRGEKETQIAKFMGPTWGPPGSCRPQLAPCWPHEPCYQGSHSEQECEAHSKMKIVAFWLDYHRTVQNYANPALIQIVTWYRTTDKPLSEPIWLSTLLTYIYASLGLNEVIWLGDSGLLGKLTIDWYNWISLSARSRLELVSWQQYANPIVGATI